MNSSDYVITRDDWRGIEGHRGSGRVLHYYARYLQHPSGVTDSINHWAAATELAGYETWIIAAKPSPGAHNEFQSNRVLQVWHLGRGRSSWIPFGLFRRLRRGDVLVIHEGWVLSNLVAALFAKLRAIPLVVVPHGVYEGQVARGQQDLFGLRHRVERWVLRQAALVHVFYSEERKTIRAFEDRIRGWITVPNGAPPAESVGAWRGGGGYYLWIGRFDIRHKGLDNLVRFWSKLPGERPQLVLAGPDFLGGRDTLGAMIQGFGLQESVVLRGRVTGDEKRLLLSECRAYIHPSRWESCSITLLEMLAAGVPSLVSDTIYAASEMAGAGVVATASFGDPDADAEQALRSVDRNERLGAAGAEWAASAGGWPATQSAYVKALESVGLLKKEGPS
jgi:glycosyltransferase involved in cell wall biosynthesis